MSKAAALLLISATALSVLVMLPGAQAAPNVGNCVTVRTEIVNTRNTTCPYTAREGATQTGYVVAVTPGATWEIYAENGTVYQFVANQDSFGTGTTPCLDTFAGSTSHWLCAKSIFLADGWSYFAKIYSGSGIIEIGPELDLQ